MSPAIELDALAETPATQRFARRISVLLVVGGLGLAGGAYAATRAVRLETRVEQVERYVIEEREARCAVAQNVYALCLRTGIACKPVSATCRGER
jgi:hypothetical protein